jgi:hypothetical protein
MTFLLVENYCTRIFINILISQHIYNGVCIIQSPAKRVEQRFRKNSGNKFFVALISVKLLRRVACSV